MLITAKSRYMKCKHLAFLQFFWMTEKVHNKIFVTQQPSGTYRSWHVSKLYGNLYLKALFAFFNLVMEDFHSSNSFIYMCQGDQVREITLLYSVIQQLSTFHGSSSKGRRKPARFPNMKSSTKFSQSQRNKFHCDTASVASFISPLLSSLPLPVCWNAHTYFRLPVKHHTPHFSGIDPNSHLIQPALTRKPPHQLQNLRLICIWKYFNWQLELLPCVRTSQGKLKGIKFLESRNSMINGT